MTPEEKKEIAFRILTRASTGLYFLQDFLYRHSANDAAYFRSLCILLSYNFELLLKAVFVLTGNFETIGELENKLKSLNHSPTNISLKLGEANLKLIGIERIDHRRTLDFIGYIVECTSGKKIVIEDFIDIRYDFTKETLRVLPGDNDFNEWVTASLEIHSNIKKHYL